MGITERNELYDAERRVYYVESYEAELSSEGTEISGEFRGPVRGMHADVPHADDGRTFRGCMDDIGERIESLVQQIDDELEKLDEEGVFSLLVDRIITNGRSTIVCWKDGSKTRVTLSANDDADGSVYEGFLWACAKKAFGSHRRFERLVDSVHVDQDRERRDRAAREWKRKHPDEMPF